MKRVNQLYGTELRETCVNQLYGRELRGTCANYVQGKAFFGTCVDALPLVSGVNKLLVERLPDHLCNKCWLTRISFIVNE